MANLPSLKHSPVNYFVRAKDRTLSKLKKISTNGAHYLQIPCYNMEEVEKVVAKAKTIDRLIYICISDYPPPWWRRNARRGIWYYDTRHDFRKRRCEYHILKREEVERYWLNDQEEDDREVVADPGGGP